MRLSFCPADRARARLGWLYVAGVFVVVISLLGCGSAGQIDQVAEAERLYLDSRWEEAIVVLKSSLLERPDDAAAHFYLGQCYMAIEDHQFIIAEGELQTALSLYFEQGQQSPISRFESDYFEMRCQLDSSKVNLMLAYDYFDFGFSRNQVRPLIDKAQRYLDKAEGAMPDTDDVRTWQALIDAFEAPDFSRPPVGPVQAEESVSV